MKKTSGQACKPEWRARRKRLPALAEMTPEQVAEWAQKAPPTEAIADLARCVVALIADRER